MFGLFVQFSSCTVSLYSITIPLYFDPQLFLEPLGSLSAGASPLHSPGGSPNTSRKEFRRAQAPSAIEIDGKGASKGGANYPGVTQENIGGTTYFYTDDQGPAVPQAPANAGIVNHQILIYRGFSDTKM